MSVLRHLISDACPLLILAPMQDVTDLPFWRVMHRYGGADVYYTEYFRVHRDSHPERHILRSLDENPTGKPVIAQMIGQDIPSLIRTAKLLQQHPVVGIDLNLGCPAPIVCRKNAGGGLLKHPEQIDEILRALRPEIGCAFTVKTRVGFDAPDEFVRLLEIFQRHSIDALTVHGRTVREMYRTAVHYDRIQDAVRGMACPVFANGNALSVRLVKNTVASTGAAGVMIGRGAIRNPWLFQQVRDSQAGREVFLPRLKDVREYIEVLYHEVCGDDVPAKARVAKMKKYLNFIGQGIGEEERFLFEVRRAETVEEMFSLCDRHLQNEEFFPSEPPGAALLCRRSEEMAALG
jgi:tRNA-dihydrouridine synthase B